MFAFFLLLKEFANIQASGNPIMMIQTITILVIAIAKLDWILAIKSALFHKFICINRIYVIPFLSRLGDGPMVVTTMATRIT
jgi:hypothetical protein